MELGFTATFFIITDIIGEKENLTEANIQEMQANGMEIGSHTHTHRYLSTLAQEEKTYELSESRKILEEILQAPVLTLAYPGGHFDNNTIECAKKTGDQYALSCKVGKNSGSENPFIFRRIEIRRNTPIEGFVKALDTSSIFFFQIIESLKALIRKAFGLTLYRLIRHYLYFLYPFKR